MAGDNTLQAPTHVLFTPVKIGANDILAQPDNGHRVPVNCSSISFLHWSARKGWS